MVFRDHNLSTRVLNATKLLTIFSTFQWTEIGNMVSFFNFLDKMHDEFILLPSQIQDHKVLV